MEQAQFGVLEMDLVHRVVTADAVDQSPWRAFTRPPGAHITLTTRHSCVEPRYFGQTIISRGGLLITLA
jgi:hypothetical protein